MALVLVVESEPNAAAERITRIALRIEVSIVKTVRA